MSKLQSCIDIGSSHLNIKILVVGDDFELQTLLSQKLRCRIDHGDWTLVFADNIEEALDRIVNDPEIGVVLSEIDIPKSNGISLLDALSETTFYISIIIVSFCNDMDYVRSVMNRGAFDLLTRPIDWSDLEAVIDRAIRRSRDMRDTLVRRNRRVALVRELELTRSLQLSILPKALPASVLFDLQGSVPQTEDPSSDSYDVYELEDGGLGLVTINVSDNGFVGVRFMIICGAILKSMAIGYSSPAEVLTKVNALLLPQNPLAMGVSVFYGIYYPEHGRLTYAIAGHGAAVLRRCDGSTKFLHGTGALRLES